MHCHLLDVADELNEKGCAELSAENAVLKIEQSCLLTPDLGSVHNSLRFECVTHIRQNRNGKITARPEKQKGEIRARIAFETRPSNSKSSRNSSSKPRSQQDCNKVRFEIEPFD